MLEFKPSIRNITELVPANPPESGARLTREQMENAQLQAFLDSRGFRQFSAKDTQTLIRQVLEVLPHLPGAGKDVTPESVTAFYEGTVEHNTQENEDPVLEYARHTYNCKIDQLKFPDQTMIDFTTLEGRLFRALFANPCKIVPYNILGARVWGPEDGWGSDLLKYHVANIRGKLIAARDQGENTLRIVPKRQVGYGLLSEIDYRTNRLHLVSTLRVKALNNRQSVQVGRPYTAINRNRSI